MAKQGAGRKADRVADELLGRIVRGDVEVGSLLPKEAELATEFGVNRSVIREAIKLLEVHRLVKPIRRRGTEVLDPLSSVSPEVLKAMIVPSPGRLNRPIFADFLEIRSSMDIQMSTLAGARRSEGDVSKMKAHLDRLCAALHDREAYHREADRFVITVARATQNRVFPMLVWWNQQVAAELVDVFSTVRPANEPHLEGVKLLVDLIARREVDAIRSLVTAFHEWSTPRLLAAAALSTGQPLESVMKEIRR